MMKLIAKEDGVPSGREGRDLTVSRSIIWSRTRYTMGITLPEDFGLHLQWPINTWPSPTAIKYHLPLHFISSITPSGEHLPTPFETASEADGGGNQPCGGWHLISENPRMMYLPTLTLLRW